MCLKNDSACSVKCLSNEYLWSSRGYNSQSDAESKSECSCNTTSCSGRYPQNEPTEGSKARNRYKFGAMAHTSKPTRWHLKENEDIEESSEAEQGQTGARNG